MNTDDLLRDAGSAWRAAQPVPAEPDWERLTRRRTPWLPIAASVAAVVAVGGVLAAVTRDRPAPPPAGFVGIGDRVTGSGTVIAASGSPVLLCAGAIVLDIPNPPTPSCTGPRVTLTGFDASALTPASDGGRSGARSITGTWTGSSVQVESVAAAAPSKGDPETLAPPCPEPPNGGWRLGDMPSDGPSFEAARLRLHNEMAAHPDRYAGNWVSHPDGAPKADDGTRFRTVMVVATVEDPAAVQERLAAIYPGNLCVTRVGFSTAVLTGAQERLGAAKPNWTFEIDLKKNRLRVGVPVYDQAAMDLIGPDADKVVVEPLLHKVA